MSLTSPSCRRVGYDRDSNKIPAPHHISLDDPSTNKTQGNSSSFFLSLASFILAMKSAKHWDLSACLDWYWKSYFDNSTTHVTIFLAMSGQCSICLIGWSVLTMIGCAWKYGRNLRDENTKANPTFLLLGIVTRHFEVLNLRNSLTLKFFSYLWPVSQWLPLLL